MKKLRRILKQYYLKEAMACWLIFWMFFGMPVQIALANPNPGQYDLPDGMIDSTGVNTPVVSGANNELMDITQTASEAIINWGSFDTWYRRGG